MRSNRIPHPRVLDIDQPIFLAGLPDDLADRRIMDVRYFWEKMMLDLEIQAAYQPANHGIPGSKIGSRTDLVDRPLVFHLPGDDICRREGRILDRMGQLKDHAEDKAGDQREDREADHPVEPAQPIDREEDEQEGVEQLETPEHEMIGEGHLLQRHRTDLMFEVLLVIEQKDPENI